MPTLSRLVLALALIAGIAVASVYALGTFVEPAPREITLRLKMDGFGR
jgi:xanthosine utilization system XapX-like protein